MKTFYVTFGQMYRDTPHPYGGHPDGWFEVIAQDQPTARIIITTHIGDKWAFMYSEDEFERELYPLGCLKRLYQIPPQKQNTTQ